MARFSWFGDQEHRVFDYKPIYFDKEKDELKKKFGHVDGSSKDKDYVPGAYIHGALRGGNYSKKRGGSKIHVIISLVGLCLVLVILIYIAKFFALL